MKFTYHAIERYRQFHMLDRPTATDEDSRRILEAHADAAVRVGRSFRGDPVWSIDALGIEVVAKHEDGEDICVTVLPPPQFRGLTPLQCEAVHASAERAKSAAAQARTALDAARELAQAPVPKPSEHAGPTPRELSFQVAQANKRYQEALLERDITCAALKTMRHQLNNDRNLNNAKAALRVAMQCLRALEDYPDDASVRAIAGAAIGGIEDVDPALASADFVYPRQPKCRLCGSPDHKASDAVCVADNS